MSDRKGTRVYERTTDPETRAEIIRLHEQGQPNDVIAARFGKAEKTIRRIVSEHRRSQPDYVPPKVMEWTPELEAELMAMFADKKTGSEVAEHFGISRSAALGKRMRILRKADEQTRKQHAAAGDANRQRRGKALAKENASARKTPCKPAARPAKQEKGQAPAPVTVPVSAPAPAPAPAPVPVVVSPGLEERLNQGAGGAIVQLGPRECKYPIGDLADPDFRFCGEPVELIEDVYCPAHKKQCVDRRG